MGWLDKVLWVIQRIFLYIEGAKAKDENKKAQKQRDIIEEDPTSWLIDHFGGVREPGKSSIEPQEGQETDEAKGSDSEA